MLSAESCTIIDSSDSLRLVFSLLKQSSCRVQSAAALCISELVSHIPSAPSAVRSLVGAIELLVPLIRSRDAKLQANVCRAIACIARDQENLAVISDHGVVASLSGLVDAREDGLRKDLTLAIETCCQFGAFLFSTNSSRGVSPDNIHMTFPGTNRRQFGSQGVVLPLAKYLRSSDPEVQCAAARALHQLCGDRESRSSPVMSSC